VVKLVYIAHGFSLALLNKPLITEPVEAWRYGPVVKSVYKAAKRYGRGPITDDLPSIGTRGELSPESRIFIGSVAKKWGHLPGVALSNWTHLPDSPWYKTYDEHEPNKEIPDELIRTHFKGVVQRTSAAHAPRAAE